MKKKDESKPLESLSDEELASQLNVTVSAMLDAIERKADRAMIRLYEVEIERIKALQEKKRK